MSSEYVLKETNFKMKAANCPKALMSFKKFFAMDEYIKVKNMDSIDDIFCEFGFYLLYDKAGNVVDLDTIHDNAPNGIHKFFDSIAEFVENGSYVVLLYDNGLHYKYVFRKGKCEELIGEIVYPEQENGISYSRAMALLHEIVEHSCAARKTNEAIEELLRLGFTDDELVNDFNFSQSDVDDVVEKIEEEV